MFNNKNPLEVYDDKFGLSIKFKWFNAGAIVGLIFSSIWMLGIFFFYSSLILSGAPAITLLFPIFHLLAGLAMGYWSLCQTFNKTLIDVDEHRLWIHHTPIPWWRGNVSLPVKEIEQIYVMQIKKKNKNGVTYYYNLMARTTDGANQKLIATNIKDYDKVLELENLIEIHLGIDDYPVKGEYGKNTLVPLNKPRKKRRRNLLMSKHDLLGKEPGDEVLFDGNYYDIRYHSQYDWKNNSSDKQFQLVGKDDKKHQVYLHENEGLLDAYFEKALGDKETRAYKFNTKNPPKELKHEKVKYILQETTEGHLFLSDHSNPYQAKQWIYHSKDHSKHLRIIDNELDLIFYTGNLIMEKALDLNQKEALDLKEVKKEKINPYDDLI